MITIGILIWLERRSDHPSFDVSLFANRGYAVSLAAVSLAFFALSGITFSLPFYLQILRGYDTLIAGLCFVPFALGQLLAAPRSASVVARLGYRPVMTGGLILVALSLIGLLFLQLDTPVWILLVIFFIFGFGMGNVIAPASTVMQNVLPLARAGAGSAVQNTVRQVGGALGVAIIGTVLATRYAANLDQVLPAAFPARDVASESIVATAAVLDKADSMGVPSAVVDQVRSGAFEAFLNASHTANVISLVIVIIAALLVGFGLPSLRPPTKGAAGSGPAADPTERRLETEAAEYAEQAGDEYPAAEQPDRTA
ncbi:MAG: MFS transporter [Actinomycetales bacterium]